MLSEPMTLYKLMILYMLRQVNFPLTEDRLSEFFLSREYTTYFTLKQALAELIDAELIRCHQVANTTRYTITPEGADTYQFFGKKITPEILKDMDEFLKENRFRIRSEVGVTSDYYLSDTGEYVIQCEVSEGRSKVIALTLSAPDETQADMMCSRWKDSSQDIYAYIMKKLLGGSN